MQQPISSRANKWGTAGASEAEEASRSPPYEKDLELAARELLGELPESIASKIRQAQGPRDFSWRLQKLIAQLIDFHEREGKVEWWEFFHRLQLTPDEREDDSEVIARARLETVESLTKQSNGYRYRFDAAQPLKLSAKEGAQSPLCSGAAALAMASGLQPLEPLAQDDGKAWSAEGVLNEQQGRPGHPEAHDKSCWPRPASGAARLRATPPG
jgi:hypothetical protein